MADIDPRAVIRRELGRPTPVASYSQTTPYPEAVYTARASRRSQSPEQDGYPRERTHGGYHRERTHDYKDGYHRERTPDSKYGYQAPDSNRYPQHRERTHDPSHWQVKRRPRDRAPESVQSSDSYMSCIESSRRSQDKALGTLGLYRYKIPGDGNCMFRAVSAQLRLDQEKFHPRLRAAAWRWMVSHTEALLAEGLLDNEQEVEDTRHLNHWPGQAALVAMANILNINIAVIQGGDQGNIDIQHITPFETDSGKEEGNIVLAYLYNGHYDAVVHDPHVPNPGYAMWASQSALSDKQSEALAKRLSAELYMPYETYGSHGNVSEGYDGDWLSSSDHHSSGSGRHSNVSSGNDTGWRSPGAESTRGSDRSKLTPSPRSGVMSPRSSTGARSPVQGNNSPDVKSSKIKSPEMKSAEMKSPDARSRDVRSPVTMDTIPSPSRDQSSSQIMSPLSDACYHGDRHSPCGASVSPDVERQGGSLGCTSGDNGVVIPAKHNDDEGRHTSKYSWYNNGPASESSSEKGRDTGQTSEGRGGTTDPHEEKDKPVQPDISRAKGEKQPTIRIIPIKFCGARPDVSGVRNVSVEGGRVGGEKVRQHGAGYPGRSTARTDSKSGPNGEQPEERRDKRNAGQKASSLEKTQDKRNGGQAEEWRDKQNGGQPTASLEERRERRRRETANRQSPCHNRHSISPSNSLSPSNTSQSLSNSSHVPTYSVQFPIYDNRSLSNSSPSSSYSSQSPSYSIQFPSYDSQSPSNSSLGYSSHRPSYRLQQAHHRVAREIPVEVHVERQPYMDHGRPGLHGTPGLHEHTPSTGFWSDEPFFNDNYFPSHFSPSEFLRPARAFSSEELDDLFKLHW